jgi:hypothetical protein
MKSSLLSIQGAEAFLSADPRLDHDIVVRVTVDSGNIGRMPTSTPVRHKIHTFSQKLLEYQTAVTQWLSQPDSASESDSFQEREPVKRMALDCAQAVLGTSGERLQGIRTACRTRRSGDSRRASSSYGWCCKSCMPSRTAWW